MSWNMGRPGKKGISEDVCTKVYWRVIKPIRRRKARNFQQGKGGEADDAGRFGEKESFGAGFPLGHLPWKVQRVQEKNPAQRVGLQGRGTYTQHKQETEGAEGGGIVTKEGTILFATGIPGGFNRLERVQKTAFRKGKLANRKD